MRPFQTRIESMIESTADITSGFVLSWLVWLFVIPIFWPHLTSPPTESFWIVMLFTGVSLTRRYVWRRVFERASS